MNNSPQSQDELGNEKTPEGVSSPDKISSLLSILDSYDIRHPKASISRNTAKKMLKRDLEAWRRTTSLEAEDLLETAWGIICNAGEGNWDKESKDWQEATIRYRKAYFDHIDLTKKNIGDL